MGVENILKIDLLNLDELEKSLGVALQRPYFSVTFHPVTLEKNTSGDQMDELLSAMEALPEYDFIITKSNADTGNQVINKRIDEFALEHENCKVFESLGIVRYLSLMQNSCGVIGNSSSGIIEAPVLKVPTINIGDRQKGRLKAKSILDCKPKKEEILCAVKIVTDATFIKEKCTGESPYWGEETAKRIVGTIKDSLINQKVDLKKKFFDVDFLYE